MLALRKTPPSSASLRGRRSSGIGRGKSIGLTEDLPAEAVDSNRSRPKGPFKCHVMQMGVGGVIFSGGKRYEGISFNVICVTRGWVGVHFPEKKRYVTLAWPQSAWGWAI